MRAGGAYRKPGGKGWALPHQGGTSAAPVRAQQSEPAWTCLPASRYLIPLATTGLLSPPTVGLTGSVAEGWGGGPRSSPLLCEASYIWDGPSLGSPQSLA